MGKEDIGKIGWIDLTVEDATNVKDFYKSVCGWEVTEVPVADYKDYCVAPPSVDGNPAGPVAGICHARGENADIPPQWMIYITVADLDQSLEDCRRLGGEVVHGPRDMGGHGRMGIIRDPAGAVTAIIEPPK